MVKLTITTGDEDKGELVQLWSGKWHVYLRDIRTVPAEPVAWHRKHPQPERLLVLTQCGERGYSRRKIPLSELTFGRGAQGFVNGKRINLCAKCWTAMQGD